MHSLRPLLRLTIAGVFALGFSVPAAHAQAPQGQFPRPGPAGDQAELRQKMEELQKVQQKLDQIRDEALEAPKIAKKRKALESKVEEAMVEADPKALKKRDRFESLRKEFVQARQQGNQEKMQQLQPKLQQLGESLSKTQAEVMQQEEIAEMADAFQKAMISRMNEVNDDTDQLLSKAKRLAQELQAAMGGARPGPGRRPSPGAAQ